MLPPPTVIRTRGGSVFWGLMSATMRICAATLLAGTELCGMKKMVFVTFTCCLLPCANRPNYLQADRLHCGPSWLGAFPAIRSLIFYYFPVVGWMTVLAW